MKCCIVGCSVAQGFTLELLDILNHHQAKISCLSQNNCQHTIDFFSLWTLYRALSFFLLENVRKQCVYICVCVAICIYIYFIYILQSLIYILHSLIYILHSLIYIYNA